MADLSKDTHRKKSSLKGNSSAYQMYEYRHLVSSYTKSTLYKRFLYSNKVFNEIKVVSGKIPFFVIGPFCFPHIYLS